MARKLRSAALETRTARRKIAISLKPLYTTVAAGVSLGYRRNKRGGGMWVVRCANGAGGNWTKAFSPADDIEDADGEHVLDFWQAAERAKRIARGTDGTDIGRPWTWAEAIDAYERDLATRGGRPRNASMLRTALPANLLSKPVSLLTSVELLRWRDSLSERGLQPATVTRICKSAKACLNKAASIDERITNSRAWKVGLKALPDSNRARNVVLDEAEARAIVKASYRVSEHFGLLIETLAATGVRPIEASRLLVRDLQAGRAIVMMPRSAKGSGVKRVDRRPLPLPSSLIAKLEGAADKRAADAPLLTQPDGRPWDPAHIGRPFAAALELAGLTRNGITPYAMRHSRATAMILKGVPLRVVANALDTSTAMLEQTYSALISDHSDALVRASLVDFGAEPAERRL